MLRGSCFYFLFLFCLYLVFFDPEATALSLLDRLISRLPTNDRPRLRTYAHQLLAATTALGVARVIRAGLPIRCGPSNRALPTPPNGLPPRPPPGQSRLRPPDHTAALPAANRPANHAANPPGCPEPPPNFLFREPPPGKPVAVEEARCSRGPLGDPGARAFGVFLKASQ